MVRKFHHRAVPSSSLVNRSLDSVKKLMTFQCSQWGESYASGLVYHQVSGAGLSYVEGDVVDDGGWKIPVGTKPVWTCPYDMIPYRYQIASVLRTNEGTLTPSVTGAQLMLRGSGLKNPAAVNGGTGGWLYGDRLHAEDPQQDYITTTPYDPINNIHGDWPYPGGKSQDGVSWFADNPQISVDSPYWDYPLTPDMAYSWYPALTPLGGMPQGVWGGLDLGAAVEYGAGILAVGGQIGLPMELQIGATARVLSAYSELSFTGAAFRRVTYTAVSATDPDPVRTAETDNVPFGMTLLAGQTRNGVTHWDVTGTAVAGTYRAGKSMVVDITALVQRMLELQSSPYDSFCLLPSIAVEALDGPNPNMMEQLLKPDPVLSWDAAAQAWYVSWAQYQQLTWEGFVLKPPVVTVALPESEADRAVLPQPFPPMG